MTFVPEIPALKLEVLIIISITESFSILQSEIHLTLQAYTVQQPTPRKLVFDTSEAKKGDKRDLEPKDAQWFVSGELTGQGRNGNRL